MNYLTITHDDMLNGDGLRVVLWVAGCRCHCEGCQNAYSWNFNEGIKFDEAARQEIFEELKKDYISGITLTGGHPLEPENYPEVLQLCKDIKAQFPNKTIWLYTGYSFLELYCHKVAKILSYIDVLVDGKYDKELRDINLKWRGSSNQRVIDVKKTLQNGEIVLLCE